MKKKIFLGLLAAVLVFGAGAILGRVTKKDVVISSSTGGASYSGGFKSDGAAIPAGGVIGIYRRLTRAAHQGNVLLPIQHEGDRRSHATA